MNRTPRALPLIIAGLGFLLLWLVLARFGGLVEQWWASRPPPEPAAPSPAPEAAAPKSPAPAVRAELPSVAVKSCGESGAGPRKPEPLASPATWITADDYPVESLMAGEEGTVAVTLIVDPTGRITDCFTRASSGHARLDAAACNALKSRGHFAPALDGQGCPIPATVNRNVRWVIPK